MIMIHDSNMMITEGAGGITYRRYDNDGEITKAVDSDGRTTLYRFDPAVPEMETTHVLLQPRG
jgi:uncharacterized protein RhaS with RHS repeats